MTAPSPTTPAGAVKPPGPPWAGPDSGNGAAAHKTELGTCRPRLGFSVTLVKVFLSQFQTQDKPKWYRDPFMPRWPPAAPTHGGTSYGAQELRVLRSGAPWASAASSRQRPENHESQGPGSPERGQPEGSKQAVGFRAFCRVSGCRAP